MSRSSRWLRSATVAVLAVAGLVVGTGTAQAATPSFPALPSGMELRYNQGNLPLVIDQAGKSWGSLVTSNSTANGFAAVVVSPNGGYWTYSRWTEGGSSWYSRAVSLGYGIVQTYSVETMTINGTTVPVTILLNDNCGGCAGGVPKEPSKETPPPSPGSYWSPMCSCLLGPDITPDLSAFYPTVKVRLS